MKILYHYPSLDSIYAHRTIFNGLKNAFQNLGHEFETLTSSDNFETKLSQFQPELFITSSHFWYRKYLDYEVLRSYRQKGLFVLTKIDFWKSPISAFRVNEARSMINDEKVKGLILDGLLGDAYFHVVEQDDMRMEGFSDTLGVNYHTIPWAADEYVLSNSFVQKFESDISYVGTNLPEKRKFFNEYVRPLANHYRLSIYGQDWTGMDRALGLAQKFGQYFNIKPLSKLQKPKLELCDEGAIYRSSTVSLNVHEEYQRKYGGDCNERTFKIPLSGGFQIVDNVACIGKYFKLGTEIIVGENASDWLEKVHYFIKNPDARMDIIRAGRERVLSEHTYRHRALQMLKIANLV